MFHADLGPLLPLEAPVEERPEGEQHDADEENPNNPYWVEIRQMKEDAEMEIARDKEIRERIRLEKQQKEMRRQKDLKKTLERKVRRIRMLLLRIAPSYLIASRDGTTFLGAVVNRWVKTNR